MKTLDTDGHLWHDHDEQTPTILASSLADLRRPNRETALAAAD